MEWLDDGSRELDFTAAVLADDAKNYHAWSHRQWAVRTFGLWDGELDFVDALLDLDMRNNSAWSHRWFVVTRGDNFAPLPEHVVEREMAVAAEWARRVPRNECAYNYLRGLAKKHARGLAADAAVQLLALAGLGLAAPSGSPASPSSAAAPLLSFCADVLEAAGRAAEARDLCAQLARRDAVRAAYWSWRAESVSEGPPPA